MNTDAEKVVPMLEVRSHSRARIRARRCARVFMLAQSLAPEARATVIEVAKSGPEPVRLAAVRELGRFGGPDGLEGTAAASIRPRTRP